MGHPGRPIPALPQSTSFPAGNTSRASVSPASVRSATLDVCPGSQTPSPGAAGNQPATALTGCLHFGHRHPDGPGRHSPTQTGKIGARRARVGYEFSYFFERALRRYVKPAVLLLERRHHPALHGKKLPTTTRHRGRPSRGLSDTEVNRHPRFAWLLHTQAGGRFHANYGTTCAPSSSLAAGSALPQELPYTSSSASIV
jgi:hypothetical protein